MEGDGFGNPERNLDGIIDVDMEVDDFEDALDAFVLNDDNDEDFMPPPVEVPVARAIRGLDRDVDMEIADMRRHRDEMRAEMNAAVEGMRVDAPAARAGAFVRFNVPGEPARHHLQRARLMERFMRGDRDRHRDFHHRRIGMLRRMGNAGAQMDMGMNAREGLAMMGMAANRPARPDGRPEPQGNRVQNVVDVHPPRMLGGLRGPGLMRALDDLDDPWEAMFDDLMLNRPNRSQNQLLFDMVRENLPCSSVFGNHIRGCSAIVEQCRHDPNGLTYEHPTANRNPLHEAANRCLCPHVIQAFVEARPELKTSVDNQGNTPLHLLFLGMASRAVEPETLIRSTELLIATAEPGVQDGPVPLPRTSVGNSAGDTVLHLACTVCETLVPEDAIDILIDRIPEALTTLNSKRQYPLHLHCQRRTASVSLARKLAPPNFEFAQDVAGSNPLHYAATQSNPALIRWLLDYDSRLAMEAGSKSRTALHLVCQKHGRPDAATVRALLAAFPEAASRRDNDGSTPLHTHLANARSPNDVSPEVVEALAPDSLSLLDTNKYLPLHLACRVGADLSVIEMLLTLETSQMLTDKLDTPLSVACTANLSPGTVTKLLEINPRAAQVPNQYGFLPLHAVCRAYHPNVDIVRSLVDVFPEALKSTTNSGETPLHLAHHGASKLVLHVLQAGSTQPFVVASKSKLGNTPLHAACLHGDVDPENIENIASQHPDWIVTKNKGGLTPLQILCRHGRINEGIVHTFYRLCGSDIFEDVDDSGHTALHSAMREETNIPALRALINSFPIALRMCTQYGDTPLHLACCRSVPAEVVAEVAQASCLRATQLGFHVSPLLLPNKGGQTPFGLCMEEYHSHRTLCSNTSWDGNQRRCFEILVSLVKILYYGPNLSSGNLVLACVSLHRKGARLDPTFIRQVIRMYPEQVREANEIGHFPMHIEASIPMEKMSLLNGRRCPCGAGCHHRAGVLELLVTLYPDAAKKCHPNTVVGLMIQNGRRWDQTFARVVRSNPGALLLLEDSKLIPHILSQISRSCGIDTLNTMIRASPGSFS